MVPQVLVGRVKEPVRLAMEGVDVSPFADLIADDASARRSEVRDVLGGEPPWVMPIKDLVQPTAAGAGDDGIEIQDEHSHRQRIA